MGEPPDPGLAREFRSNPHGRHSPALQHLLCLMRLPQNCLDLMIIATVPYRQWVLAVGGEEARPRSLPGTYGSIEEAEWAIFRMRWEALGGPELGDA